MSVKHLQPYQLNMTENNDDALKWMGRYYSVEKGHPYPDLLPLGMKILIIGSFPSKARKYFEDFYGSRRNQFWPIISSVFRHEFVHKTGSPAAEERRRFLATQLIGLTDMLTACYRYNNLSGDESLFPISWKDILTILDKHPTITRLVFTGRQYITGPLGLFITYLHQLDKEIENLASNRLKNLIGMFYHNSRTIEIMVPYSPSARLAEKPDYDFEHMEKMYRECLSIQSK